MMKLFDPGMEAETAGYTCCAPDHREDAARVARQLGMEFSILDFGEEFAGRVISRFVSAYEKGETPNPCIDCNRYMKFGKLFEKAGELYCGKIVTGHYARTARDEKTGRWLLKRAANRAKDQSYVLYFLSQEQLAHILFPLGEYESKEQVRSLAARYGFSNAEKHDSQDICFVTGKSYGDFMEAYTGKKYPEGGVRGFPGSGAWQAQRHHPLYHRTEKGTGPGSSGAPLCMPEGAGDKPGGSLSGRGALRLPL